jgi:predicted kinase
VFFVQMSGFPGSGKSTLARNISKLTGAVIIDHDIVKSALLHTLDEHRLIQSMLVKFHIILIGH